MIHECVVFSIWPAAASFKQAWELLGSDTVSNVVARQPGYLLLKRDFGST